MKPYNTGKVVIGLLHQNKPPEITADGEQVQKALLAKKSMDHYRTTRRYIGFVLIGAFLIMGTIVLIHWSSTW